MQKITPYLWFNNCAEEAMAFYVSAFDDARILSVTRYADGPSKGKVLNGAFELAGQQFMALDGDPAFSFTPAISFFVNCATEAEIDALWARLSDGGSVMMPLQAYPFSAKFGWVADKFGVSWQLSLAPRAQKITPFLMFVRDQHGRAEEAMRLYTSLFANSGIDAITHEGATVQHALFHLSGQEFMASDGGLGHDFTFTEAISFFVQVSTQEELDHFWDQLSADPSAEQCGWLKDKYGVSWQIVPSLLNELMSTPDAARSGRVMQALLGMKKLDMAGLQAAWDG